MNPYIRVLHNDFFRRRRRHHIETLIQQCHRQFGRCEIIDVGGQTRYWEIFESEFLLRHNVRITVVDREFNRNSTRLHESLFVQVIGDACALQYGDNAFDLAHSNSVVEHVGEWPQMQAFAGEIRRIAPYYYVQTPDFWCPFEPHVGMVGFHWLPETVRVWLVQRVALGNFPRAKTRAESYHMVHNIQLLSVRQMQTLFPDATIQHERILGLSKSLLAIRR